MPAAPLEWPGLFQWRRVSRDGPFKEHEYILQIFAPSTLTTAHFAVSATSYGEGWLLQQNLFHLFHIYIYIYIYALKRYKWVWRFVSSQRFGISGGL